MNIFVLLYNSGTDKEGIHSFELKGRTIVLMFEDRDDATRYCGLLEAQDFPIPTVEMVNIEEIKDFCIKLDYECKLVEKNFVPKTAEDRLLISPPQKNLEVDNWEENKNNSKDNIGDQFVEILVVIPADINDEEIALYSRLQELSLSDS